MAEGSRAQCQQRRCLQLRHFVGVFGDARAKRLADRSSLRGLEAERALFRRGVLAEWAERVSAGIVLGQNKGRVTRSYLEYLSAKAIPPISVATLYNWERKYESRRLDGLIDPAERQARNAAP